MATNEEVTGVYTNLFCASEKQLRAFVRVLGNYGMKYTPVMLSMEEYEELLAQ